MRADRRFISLVATAASGALVWLGAEPVVAVTAVLAVCSGFSTASAQSAADGPVLAARHLNRDAGIKIWLPAGRLRLVGWDRDSIVVRGRVAAMDRFYIFAGDSTAAKFGVEPDSENDRGGSSNLVAYIPRRAKVSAKTVTAPIDAQNVSGWFYSVSGAMHLAGAATSVEVESMNGNLDLDLTTPYLRARTGDGHMLVRGAPEDVDASTIGGTLDVATTTIVRGEFGSVSGDIHYVGAPARNGIFEFSSHSGSVDLLLPRAVSGVFSLSSITGRIENGFAEVRATAAPSRSMRLSLGSGGARVTVRTFKGTIRVRPQ